MTRSDKEEVVFRPAMSLPAVSQSNRRMDLIMRSKYDEPIACPPVPACARAGLGAGQGVRHPADQGAFREVYSEGD
ncbi:hypothetical protein ACFLQR_05350 [Verrucomicrobiota bacterium]